MRCEIPEIGRCCFCFPLRLGLIIWSYVKIVASVMVVTTMTIKLVSDWYRIWQIIGVTFGVFYMFSLISMALDTIFLIIFAIGAHKKDPKPIEWFSNFCVYMLLVYFVWFFLEIAFAIGAHYSSMFFIIFAIAMICFIFIIFQIYIIILVRSELLKLKRGSNFEFTNQASETIDVEPQSNDVV